LSKFEDVSSQPLGDSVVGFKRGRTSNEEEGASNESASQLELSGRDLSNRFTEAMHGCIQRILLGESEQEKENGRYQLLDMFHDQARCRINSNDCSKVEFVDTLLKYFLVLHLQMVILSTTYYPEPDDQNRIRKLGIASTGKIWSVSAADSPVADMELKVMLELQEETQRYVVTEYILQHS
jgi:hypothetical protein